MKRHKKLLKDFYVAIMYYSNNITLRKQKSRLIINEFGII